MPVSYYAIFDGHGGTDAAFYAAAHLHYNLVHSPYFPDDIPQAIRQAFKETDQGFLEIVSFLLIYEFFLIQEY